MPHVKHLNYEKLMFIHFQESTSYLFHDHVIFIYILLFQVSQRYCLWCLLKIVSCNTSTTVLEIYNLKT